MNTVHLYWSILIAVYVGLAVLNYYAAHLYKIACRYMKKTKIIKWMYFLLVFLLIENIYFALVAILRFAAGPPIAPSSLEHPLAWAAVKLLLGVGIFGFVRASLNPEQELKSCDEITITHEIKLIWGRFVKKTNELRIKFKNNK